MTSDQGAMPVGIIVAMPTEARALGVSGPFNQIVRLGDNTLSYVCGVGTKNARRAAEQLLAAGVRGVVSWGTAGGLIASLAPGTAVLAETVVCADAAYEADRDWVARLDKCLAPEMPTNRQPIYSGGRLVSGAAEKRRLADETGAVAVDMESGAIAEAAVAAGLPFVCIRVIADPGSFSLPSILGATVDKAGFVSVPLALRALLGRPGEIVPTLRLAWYFRRATQVLSRTFRTAGPRLLGP